jgi:hypothetical protein
MVQIGSPRRVLPALQPAEVYAIACLRDVPEGLLAAAVAALEVFSRRSGIRSDVGHVPLAAARRGTGPRPAGAPPGPVSWRAVAELRFGHCPGLLVAELRAARGVGAAEALSRGRVALRVVPFACAADASRVAVDPEPGHLLPAHPPRIGGKRPG